MVIIREKRQPTTGNTLNEKLTNFIKIVQARVAKDVGSTINDDIHKNQNISFYLDAGGKPALVLAYLLGCIEGVEPYIANIINSSAGTDEYAILKRTYDSFLKLKAETFVALKNI